MEVFALLVFIGWIIVAWALVVMNLVSGKREGNFITLHSFLCYMLWPIVLPVFNILEWFDEKR